MKYMDMSKYDEKEKASPVQGEVGLRSKLGGVEKKQNNPSVSYADSSLYTREPLVLGI